MIEPEVTLSTKIMMRVDSLLRHALPGHCAFCLGTAERGAPWCEPCLMALPWNLPACPRCAEPMAAGVIEVANVCGACLRHPPSFARARVPLRYQGDVAILVQRFKFSASPRAGTLLLTLLETALRSELDQPVDSGTAWPQALVSVPLHFRRARQRGFDQADWLTRRLARHLGVPCHGARRLRMTPTQRGLKREERQANLRHAFEVRGPLPSRVALVDDVMTTGATLEALAQACLAAGADEVEAWAVARTPKG
ncbi:ComF family protein [Litchfieldella rifensis]|uniref:ComF family protein n=1 Tax=Litchfieldella rifensis TaxID=762643 RepID=A0ABV7LWE3_9GAMM